MKKKSRKPFPNKQKQEVSKMLIVKQNVATRVVSLKKFPPNHIRGFHSKMKYDVRILRTSYFILVLRT